MTEHFHSLPELCFRCARPTKPPHGLHTWPTRAAILEKPMKEIWNIFMFFRLHNLWVENFPPFPECLKIVRLHSLCVV